ncbi:SpoIIE family protein phosphatase [Nocardioides donggukensis]|uniref:SpoIIE family protein phosphatase n=1 Tax=Nocardioides donggukensis TaxID=2774019 RepID=A0A927K8Y4_9ACTN|nr:SpoIIE family protein phosphatase [Nocardioides donggukensis]MBD8869815.1 SpoIIE family protein phosphatase [Nocardioides donggukensis]
MALGRESPGGRAEASAVAFEQSPIPITVFSGPGLVAVAMNRAARNWWGADLLGSPARATVPPLAGAGYCDEAEQVYASGVPFTGPDWPVRLVDEEAGSRRFLTDVVLEPWHTPDGDVHGVVGYALDVTEVPPREAGQAGGDGEPQGLVAALQDVLLPVELPLLPSLDVAARHVPAESGSGGDWFDALVRPSGRLAVVVGDVAGHGVEALSTMSTLQSVLRARLAEDTSLAVAVEGLDAFAGAWPEAAGATVGVAEIDPDTGGVRYVLAGHPPPLVVDDARGFRFLDPVAGRPLGAGGPRTEGGAVLSESEVLLVYSDGLLSGPRRGVGEMTVGLASVAGEAWRRQVPGAGPDALDRMCTETLERLVAGADHQDDISLVAVRRSADSTVFDGEVDAGVRPDRMRSRLAGWLSDLGAGLVDRVAVLHAVDELVANAAEHAYADGPAPSGPTARVHGALGSDGVLAVSVADTGHWHQGADASSGQGLAVVGSLVDRCHVDRRPEGTTVRLRHRLRRRPEVLRVARRRSGSRGDVPGPAGRTGQGAGSTLAHWELSGNSVVVSGDLVGGSVTGLREVLLQSCQAGCRSGVVDLSDVTRLGGEAVRSLSEVVDRCEEHGSGLTLVAAAGSIAQHVLEIVGLPYRTTAGSAQTGSGSTRDIDS